MAGEAAPAGAALVARGRALGGGRVALILGGETTVTLGPVHGRGGRNQELALAAARELAAGEGGGLAARELAAGERGGRAGSAGGEAAGGQVGEAAGGRNGELAGVELVLTLATDGE